MSIEISERNLLFEKSITLIENARKSVIQNINQTMVKTYFEIGRLIVEDEQDGKSRAKYGDEVLSELSTRLSKEFGKGFSLTNLKQMRQMYLIYSISQTVSDHFKLSWSHYLKLMRVIDLNERNFYEIESFKNNWSLRELQRQMDTALYQRLILGKDKNQILELSKSGQIIESAKDIIKDPYILEFTGFPELQLYSESELEKKIIDKLEHFLLELGNGFTFVARQKRISIDENHFRIDLVFYNRFLKSFVLIDLKIGELKHQDIGQMQMYVNYYDRYIKLDDENKTVGIILCQDKSDLLVKITLPENNEQIYASRYMTILPSKEDLIKLLNEDILSNEM
jgi:predicted nuclease of restriction endonuclease-like (RecB) superfamily